MVPQPCGVQTFEDSGAVEFGSGSGALLVTVSTADVDSGAENCFSVLPPAILPDVEEIRKSLCQPSSKMDVRIVKKHCGLSCADFGIDLQPFAGCVFKDACVKGKAANDEWLQSHDAALADMFAPRVQAAGRGQSFAGLTEGLLPQIRLSLLGKRFVMGVWLPELMDYLDAVPKAEEAATADEATKPIADLVNTFLGMKCDEASLLKTLFYVTVQAWLFSRGWRFWHVQGRGSLGGKFDSVVLDSCV